MSGSRVLLKGAAIMTVFSLLGKLLGVLLRLFLSSRMGSEGLGLYQLMRMQVPTHAAVNETVALAAHRGERGFVNAVLREAIRHPEHMAPPTRKEDLLAHFSIVYSVPMF